MTTAVKPIPERCPLCRQIIRKQRSPKISTHFHAHITQIARETGMARNYVYHMVLLLACEIEVDGGSSYPYTIVRDVLYPDPTHTCNNKQMMTAVEAAHMVGAEWSVFLNEKAWKEQEE